MSQSSFGRKLTQKRVDVVVALVVMFTLLLLQNLCEIKVPLPVQIVCRNQQLSYVNEFKLQTIDINMPISLRINYST